jgi:hypothetical protein
MCLSSQLAWNFFTAEVQQLEFFSRMAAQYPLETGLE